MADQPISMGGLMTAMPQETRGRILSGMRWTLWLSVIAVPLGFGTSVILARTSPEAIGTYGLLAVYTSVISSIFYLGGDTVVIKFVPMLQGERRRSFLVTYFVLICIAFSGWLAIASIWPQALHYVFGTQTSARLSFWILVIAPIYIGFSIIAATLKGMLEIRWAQLLLRLITIGSFVTYAALFLFSPHFLATSYYWVVWSVFFGLVAIGVVLGGRHLVSVNKWSIGMANLQVFLPTGFWRYMLATQQLSLLTFFASRLDYLLILNSGGLEVLGKYVAVSTVASVIPLVNNLFGDTVMPSLTNLVARENSSGASEVMGVYLRILFAVTAGITSGLILFAKLLTLLLGPKYHSLEVPVIVLVMLLGLAAPGNAGGLFLAVVGKQQKAVWVTLGQVVTYVIFFFILWPKFHLMGAILAVGVAELVFHSFQLVVAKMVVQLRFSFAREYAVLATVVVAVATFAVRGEPGVGAAVLAWIIAMGLFLVFARYSVQECIALTHCFIPGRVSTVWTERKEQNGNG